MSTLAALRDELENNLFAFARYVNPTYCYGDIHRKVCDYIQHGDATNKLVLLPRGHLKSHIIAVATAWKITREPWTSIIYLTAGEDLGIAQIYAIKNMMTSPEYRLMWPEMFEQDEGKREKWSAWSFHVDHPVRKERGVRDATLIVKTLKSSSTGLHCEHLVLDDVVIPQNAYTTGGRTDVRRAVSQFASIKNAGATTWAVGTVYHPADIYTDFRNAEVQTFDENGESNGVQPLWDIFEDVVEDSPDRDGTGNYLWPRTFSPVLRQHFGFDRAERAIKMAEYESLGEREQFFAQYYMEANDPSSHRLSNDNFQYYDKKFLEDVNGTWMIKGEPLRLAAAMDVAGTGWKEKGGKAADYTAIVVVGLTKDRDIYVLDVDQFKTSDFNEYYQRVIDKHAYWGFRSITVETAGVGKQVKQGIENLVLENGARLTVEGLNRTRADGSKQERHAATMEPWYKQRKVWHYKGGYIPELESQIILPRPRHDDLKDALTIAIEIAKPPGRGVTGYSPIQRSSVIEASSRFGGRRRR